MTPRFGIPLIAAIALVALGISDRSFVWAEQAVNADPAPANDEAVIQEYCLNISDKAAEARTAWLESNLAALRDAATAKIEELEAKTVEVRFWVERQQEMLQAANKGLVEIYAKMDPEAAAAQLSEIDPRMTVSILRQLSSRSASEILNVMEPGKAADIVKAIAAVMQTGKPGK
jgi:flagellar motility protein MotE (MotC chaperone)